MKKAGALLLLLMLAACSDRAAVRPRFAKAGQTAPELRLPNLLNAPLPELRNWEALKGKAVVLEFWATWCESCVDSISHLNGLADKFSAYPVVFISVTDETERDVKDFLQTHPMRGWVAPEAGAEVFRAFRVYGRPHTVLVTKHGVVAELTDPRTLGEDDIRRLMKDAPSAPGPAAGPAAGAAAPAGAEPMAEFYISEAAPGGSVSCGANQLRAAGMPLKYALDFIFGAADKLEVRPEAARAMNGYYDMRLRFPEGRGEALRREFFLKGLETALGLKVRELRRETEVYVLRAAPGGPVNIKKRNTPGNARFEGQTCVVEGGSFATLCEALRTRLGGLVLDETKVDGSYSYTFDFKDWDKKDFNAQLGGQLGLRLEKKLRKIRVLEVSRPAP
ncbi:MAG: redoxin domain-containing protein [Elusimicrobiota bacterium]